MSKLLDKDSKIHQSTSLRKALGKVLEDKRKGKGKEKERDKKFFFLTIKKCF